MERPGWRWPALLAAVMLIALAANHNAFQGYFEDDDLDTLTWARLLPLDNLVLGIPSLKYPPDQGRAPGNFYYAAVSRRFGLEYQPYVAVLQIIHLLNIVLLWLVLRRMGLPPPGCLAGCLFFAFSAALFDAWWKPMFVFDVLCTTFALISILAYQHGRWLVSFVAFWVAMKAKEFGIVLPVVLLCYELLLGERRWKRVVPFFFPAVIFGALGLVYNAQQHSTYSFHFELPALWKTVTFYSSQLIGIPYAGFAVLLLPFLARDRRVWFGTAVLLLGIAIYILLPGRMFAIYLYFGMTGVAIVVAALISRRPAIGFAVLLLWTAWQYVLIHRTAEATLAAAAERRAFVDAIREAPKSSNYVYDKVPESLHSWGVEGALRLYQGDGAKAHQLGETGLQPDPAMLLLDWNAQSRHLAIVPLKLEAAESVRADGTAQKWQLVTGWQEPVGGYRRIGKHATARLYRPAKANDFEWDACASGPAEFRTFIEGEELPKVQFNGEKCVHMQGTLKPGAAGVVGLDFLVSEEVAKVGSFGFVTGKP